MQNWTVKTNWIVSSTRCCSSVTRIRSLTLSQTLCVLKCLFRPMKIDFMFLVSHFQKIGEGIFHFSFSFIFQYWTNMVLLKALSCFFLFTVTLISKKTGQSEYPLSNNTIIHPEFILGRFINKHKNKHINMFCCNLW